MKIGDRFKGLPQYSKTCVLDKFPSLPFTGDFAPIEVNILEYLQEKGSNIAPHYDDFWIWGERIAGVNLLSDSVLTFSQGDMEISVPIPARSLYMMSGTSRTKWMHGIK